MMRHELEILRAGGDHADTLLLIHGINPISPKAPFVAGPGAHAQRHRAVASRFRRLAAAARFRYDV